MEFVVTRQEEEDDALHWSRSFKDLIEMDLVRFSSVVKLWKRICAETTAELNLLADNWKYLLAGLVCQYIHGLAARGVHYIHRPGPTLQDLGFIFLPELGQDKAYISETLFSLIFLSFVLVRFQP
ncbi:hypothetical protein EZV62_016554 [Acer yangbiense]|uniref:Uncharacterized protein n=1 Tax=Acer yangbiense TaxID=1000413 RepID=A0A5C7HPN5_9ROSI|nr:hypothetical protein EZV62_016554 [Acer yangbiense]